MRLFLFDGCLIAAVSDDGLGMVLNDNGSWGPAGGSRATAEEILGDERAFELSDADATKALSRRSASMPSFEAKDGSS